MARSSASSRAAATRSSASARIALQNFAMRHVNASNQSITVARIAANDLTGLSAATMVMRLSLSESINGGNYFDPGSDGTQSVMAIKNQNNTTPTFRINFRAGGVGVNYDIAASTFSYKLGKVYTIALRYTGSLLQFYVDNFQQLDSRSASGAFGTLTQNWRVMASGSGASPGSGDVYFARMWTSALNDTDLTNAMNGSFTAGAALNLDFTEGTGTPVEKANAATVTLNNAPAWITAGRAAFP